MIEEAYISPETAKLLKEKGFNEPCSELNKILIKDGNNPVMKITQQKACRWLREVHNVYIDVGPTHPDNKALRFVWQVYDSDYALIGYCHRYYKTYEGACEDAIIYCLEHLI